MEPTNAIKKKKLSWDTRDLRVLDWHMQGLQSIPDTVWEEQWKGSVTMLFLSEMGHLPVPCSQMAVMKQSLFLKNHIERTLAPSLKEK